MQVKVWTLTDTSEGPRVLISVHATQAAAIAAAISLITGRTSERAEVKEVAHRGSYFFSVWAAEISLRVEKLIINQVVYFFDSWGGLNVTCAPTHPAAAAFGPHGCSRPASPEEVGLEVVEGETPHTAARRVGRVIDPEAVRGWSLLV